MKRLMTLAGDMSTRALLLTLVLLLQACGTTPASHYYLLSAPNELRNTTDDHNAYIGIGPVRMPDYLDRPQIVGRTSGAELEISQLHRWAEPLQENFTRVLAESISSISGNKNISIEPSRNRSQLDLRISVDVTRFDHDNNGDAVLVAYWNVENADGSRPVQNRRSTIRIPLPRSADYNDIVATLGEAVYQLAGEIALVIQASDR